MTDIQESVAPSAAVLGQMAKYDHEQLLFCNDKATGLRAIIAVHDTTLGPSLGGTRMWPYNNEAEALNDVLRLSRGMTYKSAISGLNLGGGKAVIIGDPREDKSEALFRRFGRFVDSLNGRYITAEDVGITTKDMEYVSLETKNVAGLPETMGGSGDPSPVTAYGVYMGMKAAAKVAFGTEDLNGRKVGVQGMGHVGQYLVDYLMKEKALVTVTDIHEDKLQQVAKAHPVQVVGPEEFYDVDMDIYSPCALGATVNDETLQRLNCKVIAGAANNQLAKEDVHGQAVLEKGIFYAPDFLINAGGIINCSWELRGYDRKAAMKQTEEIFDTTLAIFHLAAKENIPTYLAANQLAEQRVATMRNARLSF